MMEKYNPNFERQLYIEEANRIEKLIDSGYLHDLTERPQWVTYKVEYRNGKKTKPPYNPRSGRYADVTDPRTWSDYKHALSALRSGNFNGIGFVTAGDDPFIFIDIDGVKHDNRRINYQGLKAIEQLNTCWQRSPNDGIHGIGRGELPFGNKKIDNLEIFTRDHYMTLTFRHIPNTPTDIRPIDKPLLELLQARESPSIESGGTIYQPSPKSPQEAQTLEQVKEDLFWDVYENPRTKFAKLFLEGDWQELGYKTKSEADFALAILLLERTQDNHEQARALFLYSGLVDEKTLSPRGKQTYLDLTMKNAILTRAKQKRA